MNIVEKVYAEIQEKLTKGQLNQVYLITSIQDIEGNKKDDGSDTVEFKIMYFNNILKIMENKEEYELCAKIKNIIDKASEVINDK